MMFYQPLTQACASENPKVPEETAVELRQRSHTTCSSSLHRNVAICEKDDEVFRPKSWTRPSDALSKIDEKEEIQDPRGEYKLCGYLYKHNSYGKKTPVPGLRGFGSSAKKRWFVYSDHVCKLYYYKQKNDSEPLGSIDIALATFLFDPENRNEGLFTIRCGNDEAILEASSSQGRMYWLQQLQAARREFSQRRTATKTPASRTTSTGRPEMGLIQDEKSTPLPVPDPHKDLMRPVTRPSDEDDKNTPLKPPTTLMDARQVLSNILPSTQRKIFRTSSESSKSPTSPLASHHSPFSSPSIEDLTFGNLSRKLRGSFRSKRSSSFEGREGLDVTPLHNTKLNCRRCEELCGELKSAKEDLSATQDEYKASREIIDLLQKELDALHQEKSTLIHLDRSDLTDGHVIEILRSKDHHIVHLEHENQKLTNDIARLNEQLSGAHSHEEHLVEKLSMLYSLIEAKDKAIVSLTHQVEAGANENRPMSLPPVLNFKTLETITRGTQTNDEEDSLKDALEAYRFQNSYLNKEILELNLLRKQTSEREQKLITESSEWEAKFYQIQSKYLLLLNELHSPRAAQHDHSVVSQLLQDVVEAHGSPDLRVIHNKGREYDEYGFCNTAPEEGTLHSKAAYLQKQSMALANQVQQNGNSWEERWESFLAGTSAKELPTCPELKYLIRGGIPYQYKGKVWRLLIDAQVAPLKAAVPSNYYQDLLARRASTATLDPAAKQIELDLLRTLPNNRHYESFHSDGIARLRRVLLAFSRHNLQVGYCQGLNRLAAIALLFLNEEDAFWCLVYIVEYLMPPDYYNKNLLGSQVDQRVLKDLVAEKLPRLNVHFDRHGLDISLFTFNWFLCIYIDIIPPVTYLTIWDSFLYEGSKVLFRYALAILKLCEEGVLERCDYMEIFSFLRSVPEPITDIPRLQEAAFHWVNPLSMKYLRNRRSHHTKIVKAELEEVEAVRRSYHLAKKKSSVEVPVSSPQINSPPTSGDEGDEDAGGTQKGPLDTSTSAVETDLHNLQLQDPNEEMPQEEVTHI
ncbi:TBC1 domain family member 2B-like isoform X1 [Macrobrachium nipponense]|uniref:TBC1 domain family member 2B-like isoform X1 n=1 Tax=Macrobrachium nipponense TaxID=159736 RepID=UPI0030C8177E